MVLPLLIGNYNPSMIENGFLLRKIDDSFNPDEIESNEDLFDNQLKFSYTPVNQMSSNGMNFSIDDDLLAYHSFDLNLTKASYVSATSTGSYSISDLTGYTPELEYNITSITAIPEYLEIEYQRSGNDDIEFGTYLAIAQEFEITWEYAEFYGADIHFEIDGSGSLGTNALELFLVKVESSGLPPDITNSSAILSNDLNDPYTNSTPVPSEAAGTLTFYDFEDIILEKGKYFVIANLSTVDSTSPGENFAWGYKNGGPFAGNSYAFDNSTMTWVNRSSNVDYTLMPYILPLDISQQPFTFNDPDQISLTDNAVAVNDLDQTINGTGLHDLVSNVSVEISFNNSYNFNYIFEGISSYQASNSTFSDLSVDWEILWNTTYVDTSAYSNIQRIHKILTPKDWDDTTYSMLINGSDPAQVTWNGDGYLCSLDELLDNNKYFEGQIKFSTRSPNYLYSTSINAESFSLGSWIASGGLAEGQNGSTVSSSVYIKDSSLVDVLDGELNFSIFDPNGEIIPLKTSLPVNISYNDVTNYTMIFNTQSGAGRYNVDTKFDPSVYGTDSEGFWTASYFWNNGTEVGFFSMRILVVKSTSFEYEWEINPGSDIWTNDSFSQISRLNGENISVRVYYYNISDPFFSGIGIPITSGSVSYSTTWEDSNSLTYIDPYYEYTIPLDVIAADYDITLAAEGHFLENHTIDFSTKIYHLFQIEKIESDSYHINYTNSVPIRFRLLDLSNASVPIFPDSIDVYGNGSVISADHFDTTIISDTIEVSLNTGDAGFDLGFHEIEISVSKLDYLENYGVPNTQASFIVQISPIVIEIQPDTTANEVFHNNQTSISFRLMDTNHSTFITGATIHASIDIEEAEVVTVFEESGLYTIVLRVFEPTVSSLNLFVNVSVNGYVSQLEFLLSSVVIKVPIIPTNGGITPALIAVIIVAIVAVLATVSFFLVRTRLANRKEQKIVQKSRIRELYQAVFMIKRLLVVHHETSSPVFEFDIDTRVNIDPSIISGVLQAISTIGQEMVGARTGVRKIEYYGFVITTGSSGAYTAYLFSDAELVPELEEGLQNLVTWFDVIFGYEGINWQGSMDIFKEYHSNIMEKIVEDLDLWLLYPVELAPKGLEKIDELDSISRQIVLFLEKRGKASAALIIDQMKQYEKEEVLSVLFSLVENEYLKRNITDNP